MSQTFAADDLPNRTTTAPTGGTDLSLAAARALLAAVLVAAVGLRLGLFAGYGASDDGQYARLAHEMVQGKFDYRTSPITQVFALRIGLLLPVMAAYAAAGVNEAAMLAYPMTISLAGVVLAYAFGARLFSRRAGVLAAALWAVLPIDAHSATMLVPDGPAALWMGAGVYALYRAVHSGAGAWPRAGLGLLAGLLLGLSWLHKESVTFLVPFLGLYALVLVLRDRRHFWPLAAMALGGAVVLGTEFLYYHWQTGDALWRVHQVEQNQAAVFRFGPHALNRLADGLSYRPEQLRDRLLVSGPQALLLDPWHGLLPLAGLLVALWAAIRRDGRLAFPAAWTGCLLLVFNFAPCSLKTYLPLPILTRYPYPVLLPAALAVAGFADARLAGRWGGWLRRRFALLLCGLLAVALAGTLLAGQMLERRGKRPRCPAARAVAARLAPQDVLYTDWRNRGAIQFFLGFRRDGDIRGLSQIQDAQPQTPSLVLLDRDMAFLYSRPEAAFEGWYQGKTPPNWKLVWSGWRAKLYRVEAAARSTKPTTTGP